ncbi:MAG: hypothetical protein KAJ98_14235, partial [Spirochaetaceae bacterium]|nr:hypothetical protein [Spirochaetaceae bacterium]
MDHLDDEVKLANDRYLEVESTLPTQFLTVNPSIPVLIKFDRAVNPDKVGDWIKIYIEDSLAETKEFGSVDIPESSIEYTYSEISNTLIITPYPFLTGGAKVSVNLVAGLPAIDGSLLRDSQTLTFFTGNLPAGSMEIKDGPDVDANALLGYTNASGSIDVSVATTKEVTHYYISTIHDPEGGNPDLTLTTVDPNVASAPPWISSPSRTFDTTSSISAGEGEKSIYIRFYDDNEEAFSPVIEATTILDMVDPSVSPYFTGSNPTPKTTTVRAGASDVNGVQKDAYQWTNLTTPPGGVTVNFGSPLNELTSVYVLQSGKLANIEEIFTLQAYAIDSAGNTNTGTTDLRWDRFVAAPTVVVEGIGNHILIVDPIDKNYPVVIGDHLIYEEDPGRLYLQWVLGKTDVPNEDLAIYFIGINDYKFPEYLRDIELNKTGQWQSSILQAFKFYPLKGDLLPGYYEYEIILHDKFENVSQGGTNFITYISPMFLELAVSQRTWPNRVDNVNRYPSFSWPPDSESLVLNEPETYYYSLFVGEKDTVEVSLTDPAKSYWHHTGPTALPD